MTTSAKMNVALRLGIILGTWSIIYLEWMLDLSLLQIGAGLTFVTVLFLIRDFYILERR